MKKDNLIWWIIGGIGAYALYYYYQKNKLKTTETNVLAEVLSEEEQKYDRGSLLAQYNIVLPADMVSKKVKAKGEQLRQGRFAIQPQRINPPVLI